MTVLRTLVVTFDIVHWSDRNTVCLKDLTVHKTASTVK